MPYTFAEFAFGPRRGQHRPCHTQRIRIGNGFSEIDFQEALEL